MIDTKENILTDFNEKLVNAGTFEVYFQDELFYTDIHRKRFYFKSKYIDFFADWIIGNIDFELRKKLILSLLKDIRNGGEVSRCWTPHHGIRVILNNKILEFAFCFQCGSYRGQVEDKQFHGTFPSAEKSESKTVFDQIFQRQNTLNES